MAEAMRAGGAPTSWEGTWTATEYARNGDVRIAYDRLAGAEGDPLLLIMGLGVSRFWWPAGLAQEFASQGFAVARYDQRDAGQSTRMPGAGPRNPFAAVARRRSGYTSGDMTAELGAGARIRRLARRGDRAADRAPASGPGAERDLGLGAAQRRVRPGCGPLRAVRPPGPAGPGPGPRRARGGS